MTDVADLARLRLDVAADRPVDAVGLEGLARDAVALAQRLGAPLDPVLDAVTEAVRSASLVDDEISFKFEDAPEPESDEEPAEPVGSGEPESTSGDSGNPS